MATTTERAVRGETATAGGQRGPARITIGCERDKEEKWTEEKWTMDRQIGSTGLGVLTAGDSVTPATVQALVAYQMRGALRVRQVVADYYGLPVAHLVAEGRVQEVAEARQVAMYLMRQGLYWPTLRTVTRDGAEITVLKKKPFPWQQIAHLMGRDHSTVMHSWRVIARKRAARADIAYLITELIGLLRTPARGVPATAA